MTASKSTRPGAIPAFVMSAAGFLAAAFFVLMCPPMKPRSSTMNPSSAEEIVRRATAAFNSGRPGEARALCEQGLRHAPGDPMLRHLLAAVLFSQGEVEPARAHIEASLAKRPGNAA